MKIVLIGAGNLGYHLGLKLTSVGEEVVQVCGRTKERANILAKKIGAKSIDISGSYYLDADLYIVAVNDQAISIVAENLQSQGLHDKLIVHTSGATSSTVFEKNGFSRFGVFYPLQTFSKSKVPFFDNIPFCLFANIPSDLNHLQKLANKISKKVFIVNDEQRAVLHVAAVFANNFSNHLYHIAQHLLNENGMELDILLPLISETVEKIKDNEPGEMQTGPAIRGDDQTIKKHLDQLSGKPTLQKIYQLLTESIKELK